MARYLLHIRKSVCNKQKRPLSRWCGENSSIIFKERPE